MGIRALCAAAAVVVGVGQAEAATTVDYDLWLRYDGTDLSKLDYFEPDASSATSIERYRADKASMFTPYVFADLLIGDVVRFVATVIYPDDPDDWETLYDNGGSAPICSVGPVSCTATTFTEIRTDGSIFLTYGYSDSALYGTPIEGGKFTFDFLDLEYPGENGLPYRMTADGKYYYEYRDEYARFTVVSQPAPVPLPATAALLPLGIGALAMLRKRRRLS